MLTGDSQIGSDFESGRMRTIERIVISEADVTRLARLIRPEHDPEGGMGSADCAAREQWVDGGGGGKHPADRAPLAPLLCGRGWAF